MSTKRRGALASIADAADFLGVPKRRVKAAIEREEINAIKLGGVWSVRWADLEAFARGTIPANSGDNGNPDPHR